MLQSYVIDVDGVFVGAAIRIDRGYRFVATDFRLEDLDQTVWPTLADVRRMARRLYQHGNIAQVPTHPVGPITKQSTTTEGS